MAVAATGACLVEREQFQSEWAEVDGARMHYLKAGSGPALILIHGIIGSAHSWCGSIAAFATTATVYAVDLLGLGESDRVKGLDASMMATADRLAEFMDAVHLDRADILGTSHGGAIAMLLAAHYPDRVGKLILVAPANPFSQESDAIVRFYRTALGKWFVPHIPFLPEQLQAVALGRMYGDPNRVVPGTLNHYVASIQVPGTAEHVMNILANWFEDMSTVAAAIPLLAEKPMLLLWGDKDRAVSMKSADKLLSLCHRARLRVMKGIGHLPYEEAPEEFNRQVKKWLGSRSSERDPMIPQSRLQLLPAAALQAEGS